MNERIKELLEQATVDALFETKDAVDLLDNPVTKQQRQLQLEKFAELIVLEATDIVYDLLDDNTGAEVVVRVKEHFGVE